MQILIKNNKGVTIVAALITVFLLAALGAGVTYFIASNQATRIQQVTGDQSFYTVQAGMEFALGQILEDDNNDTLITRNFSGETITINRSGGNIIITAAEEDAQSQHSITDPDPPTADCLDVDTSGANFETNRRLGGITLSRNSECDETLTIYAMSGTTWEPDEGEGLYRIRIGGWPNEYNWPAISSGGNWDFGSNDYVINNDSDHDLDLIWDTNIRDHNFQLHLNYEYDGEDYSKVVAVDFLAEDQASCFSWNTADAQLTWTWWQWLRLTDTSISNTCDDPIVIDSLAMSWTPFNPSRTLDEIRIGSSSYWVSLGSGDQLNANYTMSENSTENISRFTFSEEMLGRNYSIMWVFSDGTFVNTPLELFSSNQQDCLDINTSGASIEGRYIRGITMQDSCAADIGMTDMTLSWDGYTSLRLQRSRLEDQNGTDTYWSWAQSGETIDFGAQDLYFRNEDGSYEIEYYYFNDDAPSGTEYTLEFSMVDGTTKSVTFTPESQSQHLIVNTSGAEISGGSGKDLEGIIIGNDGEQAITWDRMVVAWTPSNPWRSMREIRANGRRVWRGWAGTGTEVNISDVSLDPGQKIEIDRIRFDANIRGRTFKLKFIMSDGSELMVPDFSPDDS